MGSSRAKGARPANKDAVPGPKPEPAPPAQADAAPVPDSRWGFPIVGIGASAGGLAAFEAFFSGMPADADTGMAFVLVQHLAPDHKSILADLIGRYTRMQVFEVEDGMVVRPDCAYIIPPNRDMALLNGALQLLEPASPRGQRLPIDYFFRSLAQELRERAIGIVLSGTGSDGSLGVRAIKDEGGMVMVQRPDSAEFDGMPKSAIATGAADCELLPAEMPARLVAYALHAYDHSAAAVPLSRVENALAKISILIRAQTGHDFSQYKATAISRRIQRRMALQQIDSLDGYVRYLQQAPAEVAALFRDLLIGVTKFFRDTEAFAALEQRVIPRMFEGRPAGAVVRVWSPGCSTGEEAYSLAMLLVEHMETLKQNYPVQVFATDIDSRAIATARSGLYPASIAADLSPERLARFFGSEAVGGAYRVQKRIRDLLVFSEQDMIKDPPFSRLDLVSCRNVLIYMGRELQRRLLPLFHYALNPGGFLFLGTSETVGDFGELYAVLDRDAKIYQRREVHAGARPRILPAVTSADKALLRPAGRTAPPAKPSLRELTEQALLQRATPSAALVTGAGDILYLHGRTGRYLEPAPGEAGLNVLKMAREGLRNELAAALRGAAQNRQSVRAPRLRVKTNGDYTAVDVAVHPLTADPAEPIASALYLVTLEEALPAAPEPAQVAAVAAVAADGGAEPDADAGVAALREELRARDETVRRLRDELDTSTAELKSSNEEMQSVNEEMQSTNEELETAKEEMQSVNEELSTTNAELQSNLTEQSRANNDMNNLLAGTGIATVFVDRQLRILRFTTAAREIIKLIPGDTGRPVGDITSELVGYDRMVADLRAVLDTLVPVAVEVQTTAGKWYMMRIQVYRTMDDTIEGAVITFVDITDLVQSREGLRRLAVVVRDAHDAITVQDLDGRILAWNAAAVRMYGWSEAEALAMNVRDRIPQELRGPELDRLRRLALRETVEPYRSQRVARDGGVLGVWVTASALVDECGRMYALATTERGLNGAAARRPAGVDEDQAT